MSSYPATPQQPVPSPLWTVSDAMPVDAWVPERGDQSLDRTGKPSRLLNHAILPLPMAATHLPAGFPSPAEDFSVRRHDLNELLITHPLATFLWKVSGTSMVDAGIFDGDIVVVNRALTPVHKDVVVAEVDGEFTIKHLYKRLGRVKLVPANPTFPEITFKDGQELRICGVTDSPNLMLYVEAAKRISADRTAVTWQPVRLFVGDYLNDSFFAGKSRSTQLELRLYKPGLQQPFFSQEFAFDNVQKPLDKGPAALDRHNAGSWGILPAPPNIPAKFNATTSGRPFDPFTLEVRIVEAPKPYGLATAFTDAVEKNKDDIKKQVTEVINSDSKKKSELSGEGTTLTAISEYLTAFTEAKGKCSADKKKQLDGKLACTLALDKARFAQQKADLACKTQGVSSCAEMPNVERADTG